MIIKRISMQQQVYDNHKGFVVLTSTLVVMAMGVAIVVAVSLWSIGFSRTSLSLEESQAARSLADACAEYALNQIKQDNAYDYTADSSLPISLGLGSCDINDITGFGDSGRGIEAVGTVGTINRRVEITGLDVSGDPTITRWEEVASF